MPVVVQFFDKVADVPVAHVLGRRCNSCGYGRLYDHAATFGLANSGSVSDSVHRWSWWTFQFATETGTLSAGYGGDEGFFLAFLGHFSRSVHPDVEGQVSPR